MGHLVHGLGAVIGQLYVETVFLQDRLRNLLVQGVVLDQQNFLVYEALMHGGGQLLFDMERPGQRIAQLRHKDGL